MTTYINPFSSLLFRVESVRRSSESNFVGLPTELKLPDLAWSHGQTRSAVLYHLCRQPQSGKSISAGM